MLKAAKGKGLDYKLTDDSEVDVVINYEPFQRPRQGKRLTMMWIQDTQHTDPIDSFGGMIPDVLLRGHATFFKEPTALAISKAIPVFWIPQACDPDVFKRNKEIKVEHDLVFVGKTRENKELKFIQKEFNCANFGSGHSYREYIDLLSAGRIVVSIPVERGTTKRLAETMAIGPALMSWGRDYDTLLRADYHYIKMPHSGIDPEHKIFKEKLTNLLNNQDELDRIARRGRELVLDKFSFDSQIERLEEIISWKLFIKEHE